MHVSRTLVRIIFVEDLILEVVPLIFAISKLTESEFLRLLL